MSVRKHKKFDRYIADFRDAFGRRRQPHFATKTEAKAAEADGIKLSKQGLAPEIDPNITLAEYVAEWWPKKRAAQDIDPGTISRQEIDLRRHILPVFGNDTFAKISRPRVRTFLIAKLGASAAQGLGREGWTRRKDEKPLSRGSVLNIHHTLSAILSEAVEDQLILANPVRGLWRSLAKGKAARGAGTKKHKIKALDLDQARRFIASAREHAPRDLPYFLTLMWAGLRPGEGLGVTAAKIDFVRRKLLVDMQVTQHPGRDGKRSKTPKDAEPRTVDLAHRLIPVLQAAVAERRSETARVSLVAIDGSRRGRPTAEYPPGPWLFYPELGPDPTHNDVQRVYWNVMRAMRRCLDKAGLPTYFSLHSLRHTYGNNLLVLGASLKYVQKQMGHASIQMTADEYGDSLPVESPGAVDQLADTMEAAGTASGAVTGENAAIMQQSALNGPRKG